MTEELKNVTIDELAGMMNRSFDNLEKKIDAVKDELHNEVLPRLDKVENRLDRVENRLDTIDEKLDRIEDVMIRDDRKRIERLEDKMLQVQVILKTQL